MGTRGWRLPGHCSCGCQVKGVLSDHCPHGSGSLGISSQVEGDGAVGWPRLGAAPASCLPRGPEDDPGLGTVGVLGQRI